MNACSCLGITKNAQICLLMLRDDYDCLGIAANMTTVIKLTQFFTCDDVTDTDRKGMTFLK